MLGAPFSVLGLYRLADHLAIAELRAGSDEDRDAWVIAQERINGLEQRLGRSEQRVACVRAGGVKRKKVAAAPLQLSDGVSNGLSDREAVRSVLLGSLLRRSTGISSRERGITGRHVVGCVAF